MPDLGAIAGLLGMALVATVLVESLVALGFGARGRNLVAVVWVNMVTNPLFNLALFVVAYVFGFGSAWTPYSWGLPALTVVLEVIVVIVEWRLLAFVTAGTWGSSRRLLAFSILANLASALAPIGLYVLVNLALLAFTAR